MGVVVWWGDRNTRGAGRGGAARRGYCGLETRSRSIAEISWRILEIIVGILFSCSFVL